MEKAIATANFVINGAANGFGFSDYPVKLELYKANGFNYGNGTTVVMQMGNNPVDVFDTRYEKGLSANGSNFTEWAFEFLKGYVCKALTVTKA